MNYLNELWNMYIKECDVDLSIEEENSFKILKDISITNISFLQGKPPDFLRSKKPENQNPPPSPCGCGKR
jgi:hypothetical protein